MALFPGMLIVRLLDSRGRSTPARDSAVGTLLGQHFGASGDAVLIMRWLICRKKRPHFIEVNYPGCQSGPTRPLLSCPVHRTRWVGRFRRKLCARNCTWQ